LIPSRDEPFGLVAVEFGRKGALGVGARVGGLGQMPGWWYMVESMTTSHLVHQFRQAIQEALATKTETRAMMRARSAKQRFPVAQWVESLEILQTTAIRLHDKVATEKSHSTSRDTMPSRSGLGALSTPSSRMHSRENNRSCGNLVSIRRHRSQDYLGECPLVLIGVQDTYLRTTCTTGSPTTSSRLYQMQRLKNRITALQFHIMTTMLKIWTTTSRRCRPGEDLSTQSSAYINLRHLLRDSAR
jgi:hypothetical protein